jgi:hypothetical protein
MEFYYATGEEVRVGDRVLTENRNKATGSPNRAIVVMIIAPNTKDAVDYSCPDGGVMIDEDWGGGHRGWTLLPKQSDVSDELTFIGRAPTTTPPAI